MKLRVLIVEDEDTLIELLEYNFKKEGYTVETATDGESALDKILFMISISSGEKYFSYSV